MEWMLLSHTYFLFFISIWTFFPPLLTCILNCFRECAGQCRHPELHVKCTTWNGEKWNHIQIFFIFWATLSHTFKYYCFLFACCGAMAIMWQARIAHCSVHCSCFLGVGGKTETALTPLPLLPLSPHKEHLSICCLLLCSYKHTITHLCICLSKSDPGVSVIYPLSCPHSQL